ncbi:3-dehydroquinate synthase [Aquibacillus sediminis]|uniref:3-dehydroquinate synthase n=1 Tax=Aquibacillus sediminis TaxID=2574734 RepID=UPI0011099406|nr:3-dehydroquinate synthase [Aquibacillus sediminis]
MDNLTIQTSTNKYNVFVGASIRHQISHLLDKTYHNILIITDSQVASYYLEDVKQVWADQANVSTVIVPAGEASKSNEQYFSLITKAIEAGLDRNALIVALGGGMVGDLAGFVAATYMRGIDYIQVPTTILAHDSSVGGKVAINHPAGKNLVGSFYPPQAVIYDVETLHTLPEKEVRSGYAEVIKHGLISDKTFFQDVLHVDVTKAIPEKVLIDHLLRGIQVKAAIVENDEKESNIRKYLNFGHTLGHAIEAELGYGEITHGEAVAIGMLFAMKLSNQTYQCNLPYDSFQNWLQTNGYPIQLPTLSVDSLIARMKQDKKTVNSQIQMVLLTAIGQPTIAHIEDEEINKALTNFFRELGTN